MGLGSRARSEKFARGVRLSSDGAPEWKSFGATVAWELIDAVTEDTTLDEGMQVLAGDKYILCGTPMVEVTEANAAEIQTVDLSGDDDPTGGTWTLTVGDYGTATGLAYNISDADLQTAIRALHDDLDTTTVSKSSFVYTVTFPADLGNVPAMTASSAGLTGGVGDTFAITIATQTGGNESAGKYAPFDSAKSNGQQTLTRDKVGLMDTTLLMSDKGSDLTGLIIGGRVIGDRLEVGGSGQATLSNLKTAMPRLIVV